MRFILTSLLLTAITATQLFAQNYAFGSLQTGFANFDKLDRIVTNYNAAQNHRLGKFNTMLGFELGLGRYGEGVMMEAKYASIGQRLESSIPNNAVENATVELQYNYLSFAYGYRPFKKLYLTAGAALNVGQLMTRHSFGGDWVVSNENYIASTDIFIDYAFPLRLKKKRNPYLFRIRPYYKSMMAETSFRNFDANINEKPLKTTPETSQSLNHFGVNASIIIPFNKDKPLKRRSIDNAVSAK